MATVSIVLTDTFQNVASGTCYIQVNGSVGIGFGISVPTTFHILRDGNNGVFSDINYNGNFGAIWLKRVDMSELSAVAIVTTV